VSSFNEKQENPELKETTESTKAIYREKSMSIQQITKGISLKTKVRVTNVDRTRQKSSEFSKSSFSENFVASNFDHNTFL